MVTVFANDPGYQDSISSRVIPMIQKMVYNASLLYTHTLSIIKYGSRASGINEGKEVRPSLHLGVAAIKKGAFGLPSTTVGQLNLYIYIYRVER